MRRWYNPGVTAWVTADEWQVFLEQHPQAHLLQTESWGKLKSSYGWSYRSVQDGDAGALVLFRNLPMGLRMGYIPRGPVGPWLPDLLPALDDCCRRERAFMLKVEPDWVESPQAAEALQSHGWRPSPQTIQPRHTLVVSLEGDEDQILARMNQKTRYNIRLAGRKGVTVRPWEDLPGFGEMMQRTGDRNEFGVHVPAYYRKAYELFHPSGACEILLAEFEGEPLAALMVFARGDRAWYFYGASLDVERNRMPTYLLQWEAMRWARQHGCSQYDLWGIPEADPITLERDFPHRSDGLWGVYRFKRGFGGKYIRSAGAWDRAYQPVVYSLYRLAAARRLQG